MNFHWLKKKALKFLYSQNCQYTKTLGFKFKIAKLYFTLSIITHSYWLLSFHTHCFNIHLLSSSSIRNFLNMLRNNFFFFLVPEDNHYLPIIVFSGKYHNLLPKQEKQTNKNALFVSYLSLLFSTLL